MRSTITRDARSLLCAVVLLTTACDEGTAPAGSQILTAIAADGQALPAVVACPKPAEDAEAWVAFSAGTLELYADGTFRWRYDVGGGYRTYQLRPDGTKQYGLQSGVGGTQDMSGDVVRAANGDRLLAVTWGWTPEVARAGGRLTADGATMTVSYACPQAPEGFPLHEFIVDLR